MSAPCTCYHAPSALLEDGWASDVTIAVDAAGAIVSLAAGSDPGPDAEILAGPVLPGMPNVHSHAFQRAMAGLAEHRASGESFWTWRETMYRIAARITPEQLEAIASHVYAAMLEAGFTSVGEFHYLHHDVDGRAFADPAEMSARVIAAAHAAGIAITHLPALYAHSGFGGLAPQPEQRRFVNDAEGFARLLERLSSSFAAAPDVRIGAALHSLRAVEPALLASVRDGVRALDPRAPIHIHAAEQTREVDECLAWSGQRPVAWLLDHAGVDERWCLVHATHVDDGEIGRLAASGAVAGLCPTTEANLGDGVFPAAAYLGGEPPGWMAIGSDSQVAISVAEELRLLEYGQRLIARRRAVLASPLLPSTGRRLYEAAAAGGARALGWRAGRLSPGQRADLLVLDAEHPALSNRAGDALLDGWIFAGDPGCVRDVMVGGAWRVREGRHLRAEALAAGFRRAQAALLA